MPDIRSIFVGLFFILASTLACAGVARAVTFTVTDVTLSPSYMGGSDKTNFLWSLNNTPVSGWDLPNVGDSKTFTYGSFTTNDFPISNNDLTDYLVDAIGNFAVSFTVFPPGARVPENGMLSGTPRVTGTIKTQSSGSGDVWNGGVWVDFDNDPISESFGSGGRYTVTFNDIERFSSNGTYDLTATIQLLSGTTDLPIAGAVPVPEPGPMILIGTGLMALAVYGKRCRKASTWGN